jgi:hypothetical protein
MKKSFLILILIGVLIFSFSNLLAQIPSLNLRARLNSAPPEDTTNLVIYFAPGGPTDGYDNCCDAPALGCGDCGPSCCCICAIIPGFYISIDGLPPLIKNKIVSLHFTGNSSGNYNITASTISDFLAGTKIYLIDSTYHTTTDMRINPTYNFTYSITEIDYDSRFYLSFILPEYNIQGKLTYDNKYSTPIKYSKLLLKNSYNKIIDSIITDSLGNYKFNYIVNGDYMLMFKPSDSLKWGGVNPADALMINRTYIGLYNFTDNLLKSAADVNGDTKINPVDALMVNRRYIGIISIYKISEWLLDYPALNINGNDVIHNIKVVCSGDVNASYIPK